MTNSDFKAIIGASEENRRDLFLASASRLGTPIQNVEKDFWVCWALDLLFNARHPEEPRLLFKGGTSLSKSFGLISRFSEDIDITVFREDLGEPIEVLDLEGLSGKQQRTKPWGTTPGRAARITPLLRCVPVTKQRGRPAGRC